jgi:hypothetical protein
MAGSERERAARICWSIPGSVGLKDGLTLFIDRALGPSKKSGLTASKSMTES